MTYKSIDAAIPSIDKVSAPAKLFERTATDIDAISLELLASNLAMWRKATRDVDALGQVVMSGGIAIANPAIAISERAQVQVRAMIAELGISAAFKRKMAR